MTKQSAERGSITWANEVLDRARNGLPTSREAIDRALYLTGDLTPHDDAFQLNANSTPIQLQFNLQGKHESLDIKQDNFVGSEAPTGFHHRRR